MAQNTTPETDGQRIAKALRETFISPNVSDSNSEPANVVDVLNYIAASLDDVAESNGRIADALMAIARAIEKNA